MKLFIGFISIAFFIFLLSCKSQREIIRKNNGASVHFITLDPGHFHAALVQKSMYANVNPLVYVYAPDENDVYQHINRINDYNNRTENPTKWKEAVYTGNDYLEKMIQQKKGNVVVISGNNKRKTEYINQSINAGLNVLADKPMAINPEDFKLLKETFSEAQKKNVLLYDIMTERYEITNMLQKEFASIPEVFGKLETGTTENPAVVMHSMHYLYKYVSGNVLTRPAWFFDVTQEGEGITDVGTHLVDLVQWECFPGEIINYKNDIKVNTARHWPTNLSLSQYTLITKQISFPSYLQTNVIQDSILQYYCNGEVNYTINNVHAKVTAAWDFKAAEGAGDMHYSLLRGSKANLEIKQGAEQNYKPVLYLNPAIKSDEYKRGLTEQMKIITQKYPGLELKENSEGWEVIIPEKYKEGHEAHFAEVTEKFLQHLKSNDLPEWEIPNMIAKYYTTTTALEMATK